MLGWTWPFESLRFLGRPGAWFSMVSCFFSAFAGWALHRVTTQVPTWRMPRMFEFAWEKHRRCLSRHWIWDAWGDPKTIFQRDQGPSGLHLESNRIWVQLNRYLTFIGFFHQKQNYCHFSSGWFNSRRKFRSQTSDNMERWKSSQQGEESEEKRSEERRCRCAKR